MKNYLSFVPNGRLPSGKSVFIECLQCGEIVPTKPDNNTHCKCENVWLDADYGRVVIRDWNLIKVFEEVAA